MSIIRAVTGMSPAGKSATSAGGAGVMLTVVGFITGAWVYIAYIAVALLVAVLLVVGFRLFLKWRQKGKSSPFIGRLLGTTSGSPATADPAMRAKLDDLRKKFEEGIEKYKSAGKDVYNLPWVLMAGPSGSGKTEAIRHCNVGFPPGLQDPLQGTGGTHNMNWWFMNPAVVLDTAGRLFMEEGGSEWKELMKLLKTWRPLQPINGMVLAIGVDSLIKDSAEKIEMEASKVARQLDAITRDLDVRFPVYIWVTKCDLLIGFREYFSTITDPQLQHQMLGWSNPADLDEQFQADKVTEHLEQVCKRLIRRRGALLSDPTPQNMQSVNPRRIDEVDALYALPESLMSIGSRLRRYLELIFVQGEWSAKPLFLRGIYFTSALQEGAELDEAIARAMGVPVDALPGGSTFTNTKKSYFLRDVLMSKVFPEKGLVTRATNVKQQQRGRKLTLLCSAIGVVVLCLAFTVLGYFKLAGTVNGPASFWDKVYRAMTSQDPPFAVAREAAPGKIEVNTAATVTADWNSPAQMLSMTADQTRPENEIRPPAVFKALALALPESLQDRVGQAHSAVVDLSLVRPLVQAGRSRLASPTEPVDWSKGDNAAVKVLASLVQIERSAPTGKPHGKVSFPVAEYLRLTTTPEEMKLADADVARLKEAVDRSVEVSGIWPPVGMKGSTDSKSIDAATAAFNAHWPSRLENDPKVGVLLKLQTALAEFDAADRALIALAKNYETTVPADQKQYDEFRSQWEARYTELSKAWRTIEGSLAAVSVKEIDASVAKAGENLNKTIDESYRLVLGMTGSGSAIDQLAGAASKTASEPDKKDDAKQLADLAGKAADAARFATDPASLQPALKSMYDTWQQIKAPGGAIAANLAKLKEFYGAGGRGAALLAETAGDPAIKTVVAARFEVYKQASEVFTAPAPAVAWGALKSDKSLSLRDAIDAIESDLNARRAVIDQRSKMAVESGTDAPAVLKRTGEIGAKVAAMGRRTAALDAALAAKQGPDPKWLRDRVESIAAEIALAPSSDPSAPGPAPSEITLPAPLSPTTFKLERGFDPAAAKRVLDDGAAVIQLVALGPPDAKATAAATSPIVDPKLRTPAALEAAEAARSYARLYFQDWTGKPGLAMAGVADKTWADYKKTLDGAVMSSPGAVNSGLEKIATLMQQALRSIPPEFDADLTTVPGQSRLNWLEALKADGDSKVGDSRRESVRNWLRLPDSPQKALSELAPLSAGELVLLYFTDFSGAGGNARLGTPATRYWDQIRLECLALLVQDIRMGLGDLFESLDRLRTLPLAMEPPPAWQAEAATATGMPAARLALMEQNLVALAGAAPAKPASRGKTIASGDRSTPPIESINRLLDRLFSGNKVLEDPRAANLIRAWQGWLPIFSDAAEPLKVSMYVLPGVATNIPAAAADAEKHQNMAGTVKYFGLSVAGRPADKPQNTAAAGDAGIKLGAEFAADAPDVKLEFYDFEAADARKVSGSRKLVSGWSVMELLSDPDTRPWGNDAGGKRWMVPVRFNGTINGAPAKQYIWMGIELSKPLPPQSGWPGPAMWK